MIELDDLQNTRLDNLEARVQAIEQLVIEVRANARLLKVLAFSIAGLMGLSLQEFVI